MSFAPIVAVGPRAALPHANPTDRRIGDDPFVLVDWGADNVYMSDITRVLLTGKPPAKLKKIYDIVLKAQLAAIDAIGPGKKCEDIDAVARKIITKAGYGKQFGHGLGHGTGLEIHEAAAAGPRPTGGAEAGHDRHRRARHLPARLGRRADRRRRAGHQDRPRGANRRAEAVGTSALSVRSRQWAVGSGQ